METLQFFFLWYRTIFWVQFVVMFSSLGKKKCYVHSYHDNAFLFIKSDELSYQFWLVRRADPAPNKRFLSQSYDYNTLLIVNGQKSLENATFLIWHKYHVSRSVSYTSNWVKCFLEEFSFVVSIDLHFHKTFDNHSSSNWDFLCGNFNI